MRFCRAKNEKTDHFLSPPPFKSPPFYSDDSTWGVQQRILQPAGSAHHHSRRQKVPSHSCSSVSKKRRLIFVHTGEVRRKTKFNYDETSFFLYLFKLIRRSSGFCTLAGSACRVVPSFVHPTSSLSPAGVIKWKDN